LGAVPAGEPQRTPDPTEPSDETDLNDLLDLHDLFSEKRGNTTTDAEVSPGDESLPDTEASNTTAAGDYAFEKLVEYFDNCDYRYRTNGDNRSICADLRGKVGVYRIVAEVDEEAALFQVFGYVSVGIPEGSRPAVAETMARANYGLIIGKFEMDFRDGELRFHASQILTADELGDGVIDRLIGTTICMLDRYLPAVLSVIYGNELPKDAIRCVEARWRAVDTDGGERVTDD
jgi:hypothetical protein